MQHCFGIDEDEEDDSFKYFFILPSINLDAVGDGKMKEIRASTTTYNAASKKRP